LPSFAFRSPTRRLLPFGGKASTRIFRQFWGLELNDGERKKDHDISKRLHVPAGKKKHLPHLLVKLPCRKFVRSGDKKTK
jgi:hypothetical protein